MTENTNIENNINNNTEPSEAKQEEVKQESPEVKVEEAPKAQLSEERKWYVLQAMTGHEDLVKTSIDRSLKQPGMDGKVFTILVPEEDIVEIRDGKRFEKKKKMFPGYLFVEMILDDSSWHALKQTPGVARFIGNKVRPIPVTDREMQRVLKQLGVREDKLDITFDKGEAIRIISGPFRGYTGSVEEVNYAKSKVKALVNIFGRDTPVEIDFEQAEKVV